MPAKPFLLTWRHYLAVAVLALSAYWPTLRVGFLWDDHVIIEHNEWIRHWRWANFKHDFISDNTQGTGDDYYRPVQAISHRLDYSLFGLRPFWFHATDLLFHIGCGFALIWLISMMGFPPLAAWLTGCLFVVHPAGIEQFLTASGRTTPLSFLFTLLCLIGCLHGSWGGLLGGLAAFSLALFTKESAVITPLLVAAVFLHQRIPARRYAVLIPMALVLAVYLYLRHRAVHIQGEVNGPLLALFFTNTFPRVLLHYIGLLLWPWNLHSHRMMPPLSHAWWLYLGFWVALAGWLWRRRNADGLLGLAWLVISLLPMSIAMITGGFMIDHWAYPVAPVVMLPLALFFTWAWDRQAVPAYRWAALLVFPLIIVWALLTHLNVTLRGSDEKMFRWALRFTSSSPIKHNLAVVLIQQGRPLEAIPYLEDVRASYPDDLDNTFVLARAYYDAGFPRAGYWILQSLARHQPPYPPAVQLLRTLPRPKHA